MEACPINQRLAPVAGEDPGPSTTPGPVPFPDLVECLELTDDQFAARFRGTAVWRAGRAGLARNAAIALGNAGDRGAIGALQRARDHDPDPVVRESSAWAVLRLGEMAASATAGG
jgi:epoxyqueuosine reductase